MKKKRIGGAGYRSRYLSHAKRALYHLSYAPCVRGDSWTVLLQWTGPVTLDCSRRQDTGHCTGQHAAETSSELPSIIFRPSAILQNMRSVAWL